MPDCDAIPQEDLLHLSSLGEIFRGFSHEVAQPLNAIMIASQVIQLKVHKSALPEDEKLFFDKRLNIISSQVQRATQIVESLRSFSGADTLYSGEASIREIFERVFEFMRTQFLKRGIDVSFQPESNLPRVKENLHLIENIVVQGLAYARDSVEAVARWHEHREAPYEKVMSVRFIDDQGASTVEIQWNLGELPADTTLIDPKTRVGLAAAIQVIHTMNGVLETPAHGVLIRIP
jgi:phosphoglycerate-specific signal transduction histidine kinase